MCDTAFRKSCLDAHNAFRNKHGVSAMKMNEDINKVAQTWVENLARKNDFAHSKPAQRQFKGEQMGENIAMKYTSSNQPFTGEEATNQWYSEIQRYNFASGSGPNTGHFTQVVWMTCTDFGVGKAQTKDGKWLCVANYYPAGNFMGRYKENVLPPVSGKVEVPDTEIKMGGSSGASNAPGVPSTTSAGGTATRTETQIKTRTETMNGRTRVITTTIKKTTFSDGRTTTETNEEIVEK